MNYYLLVGRMKTLDLNPPYFGEGGYMKPVSTLLILFLVLTLAATSAHGQEMTRWLNNTPDMAYLAKLPPDALLVVVREDSSIKTFGALISLAKKSGPGRIRLATGAGDGSIARKAFQSVGAAIKIELLGDAKGAATATLGGMTDGGIIPKSEVFHHVEADRARVLAVLE